MNEDAHVCVHIDFILNCKVGEAIPLFHKAIPKDMLVEMLKIIKARDVTVRVECS